MSTRAVITAALAETALVTWRDLSADKTLPMPSDFVAVGIVFGGLSLFPAGGGERVAALIAWGFVVATFLNFWSPQSPTKLAFFGGPKTTTAAPLTPGTTAPALTYGAPA